MLRALDKSLCGFLLQIEAAVARAVFMSGGAIFNGKTADGNIPFFGTC